MSAYPSVTPSYSSPPSSTFGKWYMLMKHPYALMNVEQVEQVVNKSGVVEKNVENFIFF